MKQFVLDGTTPVPVDFGDWIKWTKEQHEARPGHKHVANTEINGITVSTVFLGLDHSWGGGTPILFETMIFGGEHDQFQERYSTWAEAEAGHRAACELAGVPCTSPAALDLSPKSTKGE